MNAVTDTVAAPNATLVPPVGPDKTPGGEAHSPSAQPFTAVLSEQTSKASPDVLDKPVDLNKKGELTKAVIFKTAKEERPASNSKKAAPIEASTQSVPLLVPVVPLVMTENPPVRAGVTTDVTPAAPASALATTREVIELTPERSQARVAAAVDVQDSKPTASPLEVGTSTHPDAGHPDLSGLSHAISPAEVISGLPAETVVAVGKDAGQVGSSDRLSTSTTGLANPDRNQTGVTMSSRPLAADIAVKVAPEVHSSPRAATEPNVDAKPGRLRDAFIRVTAKPAEPATQAVSSPLVHSQPLTAPVAPASSVSTSVSGTGALGATDTARITQSMPHSLDVRALAGAISRPLNEGSGRYTVVIAMRPAELGQLQAVVTLHGNDLHVSITPQTQVGRDALTNAVDTLKSELSRGGVNVNVTLQDPGSQSRGGDRPQTTAVPREAFAPEEPVAISSPTPALSANQINLVL